ncbi:TIR domain-containing protein [Marinomonas sp. TW1]|uniref:TIR domain-containing protein n=1 Tax=Marinomonas sp. TW1 TaxID=1561203 RepID=UPI0007AF01F5|nr:TIR domain-containing protein [Marinomonas sp. TW1]KZN12680.1 hypothetical protein OA79_14550 [Marinomonas sp. TW1]
MKKVFVSHVFNDREITHSIKGMSVENSGVVNGRFVFVQNDVSIDGSAAIDREIRNVMSGCNVALFLVGNNNHNSPWIEREVDLATSKGLPIIIMRLPNTNGGVPNALKYKRYQECSWSANKLAALI